MDGSDEPEPAEAKYRGRSVDELFGEVRSIVNGPPSHGAFRELVAILDAWPADRRDALPTSYLEPLEAWRPMWRDAGMWIVDIHEGRGVPPWFSIAGSVTLQSFQFDALLDESWAARLQGWSVLGPRADGSHESQQAWGEREDRFRKMSGARWRELTVSLDSPESFHEMLCDHEAAEALESLKLTKGMRPLDEELVRRVVGRWLGSHPQLERLDVMDQQAFEVSLDVWGRRDAPRLNELVVRNVEMDHAAFERMLAMPALSELESLSWINEEKEYLSRFDGRALEALALSPVGQQLKALDVWNQRLTDKDMKHLSAFPRLEKLDLSGNDLDSVRVDEIVTLGVSLSTEGVRCDERHRWHMPETVFKVDESAHFFGVFFVFYVVPALFGLAAAWWLSEEGLTIWKAVFVTSVSWPSGWWSLRVMLDAWEQLDGSHLSPRRRALYKIESVAYGVMLSCIIIVNLMHWV